MPYGYFLAPTRLVPLVLLGSQKLNPLLRYVSIPRRTGLGMFVRCTVTR